VGLRVVEKAVRGRLAGSVFPVEGRLGVVIAVGEAWRAGVPLEFVGRIRE
jgi:hypothetical protein